MKIFVSGSTGFIGNTLSLSLAERGETVHALYRSEKKLDLIQHKNIQAFKGDILDLESLEIAMKGCEQVYHTAAFAKAWIKDSSKIYDLNVDGALNVINIALKLKVKKVVITSTAGVLGASGEEYINESADPVKHFSHYENSKSILEKKVWEINSGNTEIVIVNPSRVYGPGILSQSNGVTSLIQKFMSGKWRIIPGNGSNIGNYIYIDDVVEGHILAMKNGKNRERYILGGDNISYKEFFNILDEILDRKTTMIKLPIFIMLFFARILMFLTNFGIPPKITPALIKKYNMNFQLNNSKAENILGLKPIPFREGAMRTIKWLTSTSSVNQSKDKLSEPHERQDQ